MNTRRTLFLLTLTNLLLAAILAALHWQNSELSRLWSILHLNFHRDDSSSFLQVACATAATGRPVYRELFFAQGFKFIYPPSAMLTCGLASTLRVSLATFINLLALISIPLTLILDGELFLLLCPTENKWQTRALIASLGILFSPLLFTVYLGQMQALLDLLFTFAVYSWVRGNKRWAGAAVALVCVLKPPLAFFVLWALLRREWRFLAWFAGLATVFQAIAIARFGWQNELDYLHVLAYLSHHGEVLIGNQSVNGFLERWAGNGLSIVWTRTSPYPPYSAFVYRGTLIAWALLLGFGLAWPVLRGWQDRATDFLLFGLLATIASPIAWTHHYSLFYAGCIYLVALSLRQRGRIPWWCAASFLVLANTWTALDPLAGTRWNPLLSYDLFAGLGILAGLVFWLDHHPCDVTAPAPQSRC